ncbi:MAG: YfhO family protein [Lachnospiraceae bacterium]|nr:YfhO family protein [Lachnospiraceae bacterium]
MEFIKKYKIEILLVLMVALICTIFLMYYGTFGAAMDWLSQHTAFPDYFRRRFYETRQFFPSLALQLGGGENIYRDSYYGLYSPVYLLSYLLPFVKMSDYIIAVSMLNIAVCTVLLYRFFLSVGMSGKLSLWGACIYVFATPVIYHAYVHCMFVQYMPFLITGLFGVQRHLREKKSGLLIVSTFLMVMTSFYFSIGGMLVLTIYAVHYYILLENERITWKGFLLTGVRYAGCILLSVLMSAVLLLPTAHVLSGRGGDTQNKWTLAKLLIPKLSIKRFVYAPNGLGLTSLVFVALIAGIFSKKLSNRVLFITLTVMFFIPVFGVLLNGALYTKNKVFIPFIPLVIYGMLVYLKEEVRKKEHHFTEILPYLCTVFLVVYAIISRYGMEKLWNVNERLVLCESFALLLLFVAYYVLHKPWILVVPTLLFMLTYSVLFHLSNGMIADEELVSEVTDGQLDQLVEEVTSADTGWYRMDQIGNGKENAATLNRVHGNRQFITSNYTSTYDEGYLDFRIRIFDLEMPFRNALMESASRNPLFQSMMGVKYVIGTQELNGLAPVGQAANYTVYENPYAAPVMYGTNRYLCEDIYDRLTFPYNQLAFTNYAVVEDAKESAFESVLDFKKKWRIRLREEPLQFRDAKNDAPADKEIVKKTRNGYTVSAKEDVKLRIPLKKKAKADTLYFLRFTVKNLKPTCDMKITVEGAANKISDIRHEYYNGNTVFSYAVYVKEGSRFVNITLGKGSYQIENPIAYSGRMSKMRNVNLYRDAFLIDWEQTKGDVIAGKIEASADEKMITSIPYDKGFEVFVDGRQVEKEVVNKTFLGFALPRGEHEIRIVYKAPGLYGGLTGSVIGMLLCFVILYRERFKTRFPDYRKSWN